MTKELSKSFEQKKAKITESVKEKIGGDIGTLITESSLSRLYGKSANRAVGIITAYRGKIDGEMTPKEINKARNRKLYADLMAADRDLSITVVRGKYTEEVNGEMVPVKEESYFVASSIEGEDSGHLESILFKLGKKYDQDSVVVKNYGEDAVLLGTNSANFPGYGKRIRIGSFQGGKVSEFMSKVRGRPFVFESAFEREYPSTINGIRGLKLLQEMSLEQVDAHGY